MKRNIGVVALVVLALAAISAVGYDRYATNMSVSSKLYVGKIACVDTNTTRTGAQLTVKGTLNCDSLVALVGIRGTVIGYAANAKNSDSLGHKSLLQTEGIMGDTNAAGKTIAKGWIGDTAGVLRSLAGAKLPKDSQFCEVFETTDTIVGGAAEKMYFRGVTYCPSGGMRGDTNQLKALVRGIYTVQCDINDLVGDSTKPITAAYIATTGGDTLWGRVGASYIEFAPTSLIMAAGDYIWVVATVGSAGQGWCLKTSRGKNFIWLKLKLDRAL